MRTLAGLVLVLAGCGAKLSDDPSAKAVVDAHVTPPSVDAPDMMDIDAAVAAPDARTCSGGTASATGPGGTCFVLFTGPSTWAEAAAACAAFSSKLAILDTAAKDTVVETLLTVDAFVGGSDAVTETKWLWTDGTPFGAFTHWRSGEPNNGAGTHEEDCLVVAGSKSGKGWDDRPCLPEASTTTPGKYAYVCEF